MTTSSMFEKRTCGELYLLSLREFCRSGTDDELWAFAAGHVSGNAEKVYLGACRAAMFRPQPERHDRLFQIVSSVGHRYGLCVQSLPYELDGQIIFEIWLSRGGVGEWLTHPVNSPDWHRIRGLACGVPLLEIDEEFNSHKNFNAPCDKPPSPASPTNGK